MGKLKFQHLQGILYSNKALQKIFFSFWWAIPFLKGLVVVLITHCSKDHFLIWRRFLGGSRKCFPISFQLSWRKQFPSLSWWLLTHPKLPHSKSGSFCLRSRYVSKWFIRISWDPIGCSPSFSTSVAPTSTWRPAVAKGMWPTPIFFASWSWPGMFEP